jgi:hypothetical protein
MVKSRKQKLNLLKSHIQLLRYKDQVIGATSPFSIFFTGVDYSKMEFAADIKWYRNGKFENPINNLDRDKLQKLYLFIKNLNDNFSEYEKTINTFRPNQKLDLTGLKKFLRNWQSEISNKEKGLEENGTVAKYPNLDTPFKNLLASEQKVIVVMMVH